MPLEADDAFIAAALGRAAERVRREPTDKSFLEKRLAEAVAASLADGDVRPDLVVRDKKLSNSHLPGWNPQPGTIDVAIVTPDNEPRIVFELKIDDVEWTLWDIYKMLSATQLATVEAAYVVVAGRPKLWSSRRDCVELFDLDYSQRDGEVDSVEWHSRFLFSEYQKAWAGLLEGGSGRLQRVPDAIRITAVGRWPLPGYPGYELRAIRVDGPELTDKWIDFLEDWPVPPPPPAEPTHEWELKLISTEALTIGDLPAPDAEEDAYHRFALSFNGYEEMGSLRRCARLGNDSIQRWRECGELPETMQELRACLFFEQRRWHHYGDGFDDETTTYVKGLVAKLRERLEERTTIG